MNESLVGVRSNVKTPNRNISETELPITKIEDFFYRSNYPSKPGKTHLRNHLPLKWYVQNRIFSETFLLISTIQKSFSPTIGLFVSIKSPSLPMYKHKVMCAEMNSEMYQIWWTEMCWGQMIHNLWSESIRWHLQDVTTFRKWPVALSGPSSISILQEPWLNEVTRANCYRKVREQVLILIQ